MEIRSFKKSEAGLLGKRRKRSRGGTGGEKDPLVKIEIFFSFFFLLFLVLISREEEEKKTFSI